MTPTIRVGKIFVSRLSIVCSDLTVYEILKSVARVMLVGYGFHNFILSKADRPGYTTVCSKKVTPK